MNGPIVTVVMATCNQARYLRDALESLIIQTLPPHDFEVIVINDGSSDETAKVLQNYVKWVHLIEHENRGLVASCNEGLAKAHGRYFARVDSDDYVAPEWLECFWRIALTPMGHIGMAVNPARGVMLECTLSTPLKRSRLARAECWSRSTLN